MHNMIIEDARDENLYDQWRKFQDELVAPHPKTANLRRFFMCTKRFMIAPLTISYRRI
jgi:hypothetical protein